CVKVPGRPVAADADADRSGTAPFALRIPYRVENALSNTLERAVGASEVRQFDRQRILRVGVFAAAAFEDQFDFNLVAFPLIKVDDGRAGGKVVAGILAGDRIDGIRTELAAPGGLGDGFADLAAHPDLVRADRHMDLEGRHPRVLTDRPFVIDG